MGKLKQEVNLVKHIIDNFRLIFYIEYILTYLFVYENIHGEIEVELHVDTHVEIKEIHVKFEW